MRAMFPEGDVPVWVREAMVEAQIDLTGVATAEISATDDTIGTAAEGLPDEA